MSQECQNYMSEIFTPESIEVPSLNKTFCDTENIDFDLYDGPIKNLVVDKQFRRGKILKLFSKGQGFR